jgi:hypothetical protein
MNGNAMNMQAAPSQRWYHEPWPWLLMAGPVAVILAGAVTIYLAVATNDGLVADDYYKRGLAINQTLSRDAVARQLGHLARIVFAPDFGRVEVALQGDAIPSGPLILRLAHSGRPALDRALPLTLQGGKTYAAAFPVLSSGRWQVTLEDAARSWRLVGDVQVPGHGSLELVPR